MFYTDLETWLFDFHDEKIFMIERKKSLFTPYEQNEKFVDDSVWETVSESAKIVEAIELPNKDVLLGFRSIWYEDVRDDDNSLIDVRLKQSEFIDYYPLSEIKLTDISDEF